MEGLVKWFRSALSPALRKVRRQYIVHGPTVSIAAWLEVAWMGGETLSASGNSFATPHVSAICALIRSKHPDLTPFQLKSVLHLTSTNVGGSP